MANSKTRQMDLLLHDFELLAKTALTQLQIAHKLLQDNTVASLYEEAEANEVILDRLEIKVREEVVFTIFQFNPKASDLRAIISHQDVTTNLERIGDMLLNVIHLVKDTNLPQSGLEEVRKKLDKMAGRVGDMLRNAIFSFSNMDSLKACQVIKDDDEVDELFHNITLYLQETFENRKLDKAGIKNMLNIESISHNLERVGDSATNIAEAAVYLAEGKDIRHGNKG